LSSATLELLAPRAEVWAFLAEPYNLSDWWPGVTGVQPDRRGFAPGARWKVQIYTKNVFTGPRPRESLVLINTIEPYERWAWHLLATRLDVEIRLRAVSPDRTLVVINTSGGPRNLAKRALRRLYDLCQTAADR
jgi:uncharacterized protein YndB with AHSA1/START domain